jgi:hypothetical protein
VKLKRRKILPIKPQANEMPLSPKHHLGSGKPFDCASTLGKAGSYSFLHDVTKAAMDMTLAKGPVVAASNGMAVEQNHQS